MMARSTACSKAPRCSGRICSAAQEYCMDRRFDPMIEFDQFQSRMKSARVLRASAILLAAGMLAAAGCGKASPTAASDLGLPPSAGLAPIAAGDYVLSVTAADYVAVDGKIRPACVGAGIAN